MDASILEDEIRRSIAERGFYVVPDEHIRRICDAEVIEDAVLHREALRRYAAERGWIAEIQTNAVIFRPY